MVGVVLHDRKTFIFETQTHAAFHTRKTGKDSCRLRGIQPDRLCSSKRRDGVQFLPGAPTGESFRIEQSQIRLMSGEIGIKPQGIRMIGKQSVGAGRAHIDQGLRLTGVLLKIGIKLFGTTHTPGVVVLHIGHDPDMGKHRRMGAVALVHFRHKKIVPLSCLAVATFFAGQETAHQIAGVQPRLPEQIRQEPGNACLSMGTTYRNDPFVQRGKDRQRISAPQQHRVGPGRRCSQFRILRSRRAGMDQQEIFLRGRQVIGAVSFVNGAAGSPECLRSGRGKEVGAGNTEAVFQKDLRQREGADTRHANTMDLSPLAAETFKIKFFHRDHAGVIVLSPAGTA